MKEKNALEQGTIEKFADAYVKEAMGMLQFVELAEPPFADGICNLDGKKIFIEVGHIYGTTSDIKQLLGRTGFSAPTDEESLKSRLIPLNHRLIQPLNRLLEKKGNKKYKGSPVWLLIRNGMPIWAKEEFQEYYHEILVPDEHPFEQIWLLCGPRSDCGVLKLF